MKLTNEYIGYAKVKYIFEYEDCDDFSILDQKKCNQCYAVCFIENTNQIVIVHNKQKNTWGLIGGTIEKDETFEKTIKRELLEEGNIKLINFKPIGYQKVIDSKDKSYVYQLRFMCKGQKNGEFENDPDGKIDQIAFIDTKDVKKYFDWGKIGDRIIERALELKSIGKRFT